MLFPFNFKYASEYVLLEDDLMDMYSVLSTMHSFWSTFIIATTSLSPKIADRARNY